MDRSTVLKSILLTALKVPVLIYAGLLAAFVMNAHVDLLPTFLQPGYENFWKDMIAYRIEADGHKSLSELYEAYDGHYINDFALHRSLNAAMIPSEVAALQFWISNSVESDGTNLYVQNMAALGIAIVFFPLFYFPIVLLQSTIAKTYIWSLCRGPKSAYLFIKRFETPVRQRIWGGVASLPMVIVLAGMNAFFVLRSDADVYGNALSRVGFNIANLTVIFVLLSYFSGLGIRFIQYLIDGTFIVFGWDPEKSYVDELLAILLTAPVLLFLFRNSPLSVMTDISAGLGPVVIAKFLRGFTDRDAEVAEALPVVWPDAIYRNLALVLGMLGVGALFCCCGVVSYSTTEPETEPLRITVKEVEEKRLPKDRDWVEVTDGYLFWPNMFKTPDSDDEFLSFQWKGYHFVPLVSREVLDEWLTQYRRDKEKAAYSFAKARVVCMIHYKEFDILFPKVSKGKYNKKDPYAKFSVRGEVDSNSLGLVTFVKDSLPRAKDVELDKLVVVERNSQPVEMALTYMSLLISFLAVFPPILRLIAGWPKRSAKIVTVQEVLNAEIVPVYDAEVIPEVLPVKPPEVKPAPPKEPPPPPMK